MNEPITTQTKTPLCIALLAHVDAGKTTLSEAILYNTGVLRRLGRVDHKDTFLDTAGLEKSRGITIFSKQAQFTLKGRSATLLDTPGHVDFSAEMERTLSVLDAAVLVVSAADGVQGHTRTLWQLLERYRVPTVLFVNKMDQPGTDKTALLKELKTHLSGECVDFDPTLSSEDFFEEVATASEELLEEYLTEGAIDEASIREAIANRLLFPVYFGSALKNEGVEELLDGLSTFGPECPTGADFSARVFKITRDEQGNRLTHVRITGGSLKIKDMVGEEKVSGIRILSGDKQEAVTSVGTGSVACIVGLENTFPGQGLGAEEGIVLPVLEPVLNYRLTFPDGEDVRAVIGKLRQLEEEEPELRLSWEEQTRELHIQLMGEVQIEVITALIYERYHLRVAFDEGRILYRETIRTKAEGVGHFEPLRHYAEVHLLLEPGENGSGLVFENRACDDDLAENWQRLILTHLQEKKHKGVLTGAPITDMKISLLTGRAHLKHTEGGDFRQATYRAVRQGLMEAESILLEPWVRFELRLPSAQLGRAMTELKALGANLGLPDLAGEDSILSGDGPYSTLRNYQGSVNAYTGGKGHFSFASCGYAPCHNPEEVLAASFYDPLTDRANPVGSVFCTHGAGYYVEWDEVRDFMHVESGYEADGSPSKKKPEAVPLSGPEGARPVSDRVSAPAERVDRNGRPLPLGYHITYSNEDTEETGETRIYRGPSFGTSREAKELEAIFVRTYGEEKRERRSSGPVIRSFEEKKDRPYVPKKGTLNGPEYLLVDGYNVIFADEAMRELANSSLDGARDRLIEILCNYQAIRGMRLILVFDAYRVENGVERVIPVHNIHVVYTREAETADQYIEKAVHVIAPKNRVTVATSDGVEQLIIMGQGGIRMASRELWEDIARAGEELAERLPREQSLNIREGLFENAGEEVHLALEKIRNEEEEE